MWQSLSMPREHWLELCPPTINYLFCTLPLQPSVERTARSAHCACEQVSLMSKSVRFSLICNNASRQFSRAIDIVRSIQLNGPFVVQSKRFGLVDASSSRGNLKGSSALVSSMVLNQLYISASVVAMSAASVYRMKKSKESIPDTLFLFSQAWTLREPTFSNLCDAYRVLIFPSLTFHARMTSARTHIKSIKSVMYGFLVHYRTFFVLYCTAALMDLPSFISPYGQVVRPRQSVQ